MTSVLTVGLASAASAAPGSTISEAVGFPVNTETLGGTTLTVNPQKVGDLIVFQSQISSHSITVTGVSCPETGVWHLAQRYVDTVNGVLTEEIWWAVSTSTGSTKITATYSSSIAALSPELVSDSFTTSSSSVWSLVSGNGAAAASTTAITFPSVTGGSNTKQLYWGYAESTQTALAGRTKGFTYSPTAEGNLITSDVSLSPNTKYAPTASETPVSNNTSIGAIFAAFPAAGTFTVTFSGNGSTSGSMSPETASAPTALSANAFVNTGYNFAGWNTLANGTGTPYAAGASYPFAASTLLYAQWTAVANYTVTFSGNGSTSGSMSPETASAPAALSANAFVNTGYNFAGWNTLANGTGTPYAAGASYPFAASTLLYAQWTAVANYTVTFSGNGSTSGSMSPETASAPTALSANAFVNTGYNFAGWNTLANGTGTPYAAGASYPFAASTLLYAQWTAVKVNVTEAAGFPVNSETLGGATLTVNPKKAGDIVIFQSQIHSHSITLTGVSCPETGAWHLAERYVDTVNGVIAEEIWWAVSTSTGSTKITATYSSSIAAISPELIGDSFTTSSSSVWSLVSGNGAAAASTTAITFPSVTSGSNTNQLYWGYVESTQTALAGSTAGFTYSPTAEGNLVTSDVALSPNTKYAPTASETPVSNYTAIGAIFTAVAD
jgi:hypothetical protein